jgi:hypothetical protein
MMLATDAFVPASWEAMLPQKFSAATTRTGSPPPALEELELEPQPAASTVRTAVRAISRGVIA